MVERDPRREAHTLLAWVLIAGELDLLQGIDLAEQALGMRAHPFERAHTFTFQASPRHCLGLAYLKQGERDRAASMLRTAAAERPDRTLIREHLRQAEAGE